MSMRAVFNDYHIVYVIIHTGALTLKDMASVLQAYPWMMDGFMRNRHAMVSAFGAKDVTDVMTGLRIHLQCALVDSDDTLFHLVSLLHRAQVIAYSKYIATAISLMDDPEYCQAFVSHACHLEDEILLRHALDHGALLTNRQFSRFVRNNNIQMVHMVLEPNRNPSWCIRVNEIDANVWKVVFDNDNIDMLACLWHYGYQPSETNGISNTMYKVITFLRLMDHTRMDSVNIIKRQKI